MHYVIPNEIKWIRELKKWLPQKRDALPTMRALDSWARSLEGSTQWGECLAFCEVYPMRGAAGSNVDFLLAFEDRAAMCEVKNKPISLVLEELGGACDQIGIRLNLLRSGLASKSVRFRSARARLAAMLFLPELTSPETARVQNELNTRGFPHIVACCGARSDFGATDDLRHRLAQELAAPQADRTPSMATATLNLIRQKVLLFPQLDDLLSFLSQYSAQLDYLVPDSWYIPELRNTERLSLESLLTKSRFVEVVGPPVMGKSALIKDYLNRSQRNSSGIRLSECQSRVERVLQQIYRGLHGHDPYGAGPLQILAELDAQDSVIWIESYDSSSRRALVSFLQLALANRPIEPSKNRTLWIIESLPPGLGVAGMPSIGLSELSTGQLTQIMERVTLPSNSYNLSQIIATASGNPGRAIAMAREPAGPQTSATPSHFDWFLADLGAGDKTLLHLFVVLASHSPLGLTQKLFSAASCLARPLDLDQDVIREAEAIVDRLERFGLIRVHRVEPDLLPTPDDAFANVVPSLVFIEGLNQHFADYVDTMIPSDLRLKWIQCLKDGLTGQYASTFDLSDVTFNLLNGDVEPFLLSVFRHTNTHVDNVLDWVSTHVELFGDTKQAYLVRALRLLSRLASPDVVVNIATDLGEPDAGDPRQAYAHTIVSARLRGKTEGETVDIGMWRSWADSVANPDLKAEVLVRLTEVLRRREDLTGTWKILQELLATREVLSPVGRGLVFWHVYRFLNAKKDAERVGLGEADAGEQIVKHLSEFVGISLAFENMRGLCNALFYYTRAVEFHKSRNRYDQVLATLPALEFVEQASPSRRLQAILTQGSVHRHFCRQDRLAWPEFEDHLVSGLQLYRRAYRTALFTRQVTHRLNAASYMGDFCRLGLRFASSSESFEGLASAMAQSVTYLRSTLAQVAPSELSGDDDRRKLRNIAYEAALLSYVLAAATSDELSEAFLATSFDGALQSRLQETIRMTGPIHKRISAIKGLVLDLERVLLLTQSRRTNGRNLSGGLQHSFVRTLVDTYPAVVSDRQGQLHKPWTRLMNAVKPVRGTDDGDRIVCSLVVPSVISLGTLIAAKRLLCDLGDLVDFQIEFCAVPRSPSTEEYAIWDRGADGSAMLLDVGQQGSRLAWFSEAAVQARPDSAEQIWKDALASTRRNDRDGHLLRNRHSVVPIIRDRCQLALGDETTLRGIWAHGLEIVDSLFWNATVRPWADLFNDPEHAAILDLWRGLGLANSDFRPFTVPDYFRRLFVAGRSDTEIWERVSWWIEGTVKSGRIRNGAEA